MSKKFKRLFSLAMSLVLATSVVGCSSGTEKSAMGRYVEERYESPKDVYVQNIVKLENGQLAMVAQKYDENGIQLISYRSEDGGKTWSETSIELPKEEGKETVVNTSNVLTDGRILINYYFMKPWVEPEVDADGNIIEEDFNKEDMWSDIEYKYAMIDETGTLTEVEIIMPESENSEDEFYYGPQQFKTASNGDLFCSTGAWNEIVQFDGQTLEEKNVYVYDDYFNDFSLVGDSLIVYGYDSIVEFDINTGNEKGNLEKLEKEALGDNVQYYPTFISTNSSDKLYYYTTLGLYEYDMNSQTVKQLVDAALSSFGDTEMNLTAFVEKENGEFLAAFNDWNNNEIAIINYTYDADIPAVPDKQIRIYSLMENDTMRQLVSSYSKLHPDTYVKYEVGMTWGESGVTESDVLKTLNTEIMAGNGPDIILLDGLPVESYIEKGLLEDISDVINPLVESGAIFSNIADAYNVDGKIYQFPTRFKYPMLVGNKDDVNSVTDLKSLVELTKKLEKSGEDKRIFEGFYSAKSLAYGLYYLYGSDWLNSDNTINVDDLSNFFTLGKEMYTAIEAANERYNKKMEALWNDKFQGEEIPDEDFMVDSEEIPEENEEYDDPYEEISNIYELQYATSPSVYPDSLLMDDSVSLLFGGIDSSWGYTSLITALLNNKNLDYKVLARGEESIFIPIDSVGINAKSENKEEAKEIIKELFSEKDENRYYGQGLTVNKESFKKQFEIDKDYQPEFDEETQHYFNGTMGWSDEFGNMKEVKSYMPNDDDVNRIMGEIENLKVATTINKVLLIEVAKQFEAFASGDVTLDDAINTIVDNLDLYLAE